MSGRGRRRWATALGCAVALASAPAAAAAPPANDDRADAQALDLPARVNGTLVDATLEASETTSDCRRTDASVWYRFTPPADRNVIIQFDAASELDATVDVYERVRSQLSNFGCEVSDDKGAATLELTDLDPAREVFIRVGKLRGADAARFDLDVLVARPPAEPPGRPLPAKGAQDSVDRLLNPSDAYFQRLRAGTPYRFVITSPACVTLSIYRPGTKDFDDRPEQRQPCGRYRLFTPERSGRYLLLAEAGRGRGTQPYRLRSAPATDDDTAPGVFIGNDVRVRARVNGGLDSVDLYRFDVTRRSELTLRVEGGPELRLLRDDGKRLDRGSVIRQEIDPGRYYAAVQGEGAYVLRRVSRAITRTAVAFDGQSRARAAPGATVTLSVNVSPAVSGRATILVERLDPLARYQFLRRYRLNVTGGRASVAFTPPRLGRYRATAVYRGTRTASRSETRRAAKLRVAGPLTE